jgi:hypothetical protein
VILTPVRWYEAHPERWQREIEAMSDVAPELTWCEELEGTTGGGWVGTAPKWPFAREGPPDLDTFLDGGVFQLEIRCSAAHPAAAPAFHPIDPVPDLFVRTYQAWHVMGDGSLCLLQNTLDWTGRELAAELVIKAAGWYLEYLLLRAEKIEAMTVAGIATDDQLDRYFTSTGDPAPGIN